MHPLIESIKERRILISPLDWGLGHAARIANVIKYLKLYNSVVVVCGPSALEFMRRELPDTEIIPIDDWRIKYPKGKISFLTILGWVPVVIRNSIHEHFFEKKIIKERNINLVLSDNRYGLIYKGLECLIVTHQVYPKAPRGFGWIENLTGWLFKKYLRLFDKVIIPDLDGERNLSGMLAASRKLNPNKFVKVGILSRYCINPRVSCKKNYRYDVMVLISGQENQRTVFENRLIEALGHCGKKVLMIRGVSNSRELPRATSCIEYVNMLGGKDLENAFMDSAVVVCRAGYSTLCDVVALEKKAVIVATPGQTEQEYLAHRLDGEFGFRSLEQDDPKFNARILELIETLSR